MATTLRWLASSLSMAAGLAIAASASAQDRPAKAPAAAEAALMLSVMTPITNAAPLYQLRVYQLYEPSKARFHTRFRDHAKRIMVRHGFDIAAIWEARNEDKPEFVYLLRWPDEARMKAGWASFMADPEWAEIKRRTAVPGDPMVGAIVEKPMRLLDYSPAFR